jgi:hypothetical protein
LKTLYLQNPTNPVSSVISERIPFSKISTPECAAQPFRLSARTMLEYNGKQLISKAVSEIATQRKQGLGCSGSIFCHNISGSRASDG